MCVMIVILLGWTVFFGMGKLPIGVGCHCQDHLREKGCAEHLRVLLASGTQELRCVEHLRVLPTPVHQELAKHLCLIGTADVEVGHAEFFMFMSVKVVWGAAAALNVTALSAMWGESLLGL